MMDRVSTICASFFGALALVGIAFTMSQCSIQNNKMYYETITSCVQQGGSWIDNPSSQTGHCIKK